MLLRSLLALACLSLLPCSGIAAERFFEFTYAVNGDGLPAGKQVDIFLPLAVDAPGQRIVSERIDASLPGERSREASHGNALYHVHRSASSAEPVNATLTWTVARSQAAATAADEQSTADIELYLAPNELVPVDHEILQPILKEVRTMRADDSPQATARAIYDWVVDNVEYKKVGTGWGNGDTFWACSERYGNCTDFHALFISLARTEGIPARFEIGFPIPTDRGQGRIDGYHCWVRFYLPDRGWVPIDASEAAKHPEQRELLYGNQPADRIHFTTGRDLRLPTMAAQKPLNYFIYPYVEVDGKPWPGKLETRFEFREVSAPSAEVAAQN